MKRFLKYSPTLSDVLAGIIVMMFGLLMVTKGNVYVQSTPEAELMPIGIPHGLPFWVAWLFIWYGFDLFISGGRLAHLVFDKTVGPLVRGVVKNIKGEKLKSVERED